MAQIYFILYTDNTFWRVSSKHISFLPRFAIFKKPHVTFPWVFFIQFSNQVGLSCRTLLFHIHFCAGHAEWIFILLFLDQNSNWMTNWPFTILLPLVQTLLGMGRREQRGDYNRAFLFLGWNKSRLQSQFTKRAAPKINSADVKLLTRPALLKFCQPTFLFKNNSVPQTPILLF